jgi:biopolymer transport protein ExbD
MESNKNSESNSMNNVSKDTFEESSEANSHPLRDVFLILLLFFVVTAILLSEKALQLSATSDVYGSEDGTPPVFVDAIDSDGPIADSGRSNA